MKELATEKENKDLLDEVGLFGGQPANVLDLVSWYQFSPKILQEAIEIAMNSHICRSTMEDACRCRDILQNELNKIGERNTDK